MRRALPVAGTVLGAVVLTGLLPVLSGRDPALAVLRARAAEREADPAALAAVRAELGLDEPGWWRALRWPLDAARGDLGTSWVSGRPVAGALPAAVGVSLTLALLAALVAVVVGVGLAAPAVLRVLRGRPPAVSLGAGVLAALPEFLLAAVGVALVATRWGVLPTSGWTGPRAAVLPALALGLPTGAVLAVLLGGSAGAALREPWVRARRAAGLPARRLLVGAARRAVADLAPQLSLLVAGLLGGAVAVESVFAVPGLGRLASAAARSQDVPVVQACVALLLAA
ncbi:ABC transporter permease, partial [Rhodococcus aerolatus]